MKKLFIFLLILILLSSFDISGQTWSKTTRLTWSPEGWTCFPKIAADSGSGIHVVWQSLVSGGWNEVYYKNRK